MSNNSKIQKEGIGMNDKLNFGEPTLDISQYTYFITLEDIDWGAQFYYYYRITNDNYIQIASGLDDKKHTIWEEYKCIQQDLKSKLKYILSQGLEANSLFYGFPSFVESTLFTDAEFSELIEEIIQKKTSIKNKAIQHKTPFIDYLEKNNFNPKPTGNTKYSWIIGCPNAGGNHFLMISTLNDEWGCGYCRRKGDLEDFKNWLRELDRKKLTQFVKEINTGNKLSDKIKKWWLSRY